jgi:proline dehydrogenase
VLKARARDAAVAAFRPLFKLLSRAYVVGPDLSDAIDAYDRFAGRGRAATIGYFNALDETPRAVADLNLAALDALAKGRRGGYVSIKVPAMQFDAGLINEIARRSGSSGIGIHFDSHGAEAADRTFECVVTALRETSQVGCTLPGRWPRSLKDADRAVELGVRVRVVKGQWADPSQPDVDPRSGYLAVVERLAGRARAVGVATHDPVAARAALRRLRGAGTPCELELLLGLPMRAASTVARDEGVPIRMYLPFGTAFMPYALGHLRRNPGIAWWMLKDLLAVLGSAGDGGNRRPGGGQA